jgi:hypothetical protein
MIVSKTQEEKNVAILWCGSYERLFLSVGKKPGR